MTAPATIRIQYAGMGLTTIDVPAEGTVQRDILVRKLAMGEAYTVDFLNRDDPFGLWAAAQPHLQQLSGVRMPGFW